MTVDNLFKRGNTKGKAIKPASRTIKKTPYPRDRHIQWKDPEVDKVYLYTSRKSEPKVHWRDPVVEATYHYPANPSSTRKVAPPLPPKTLPKGILKEHEEAPGLSEDLPDAVLIEASSLDQSQREELSKYHPLIPWNPKVPKLDKESSKSKSKNSKRDDSATAMEINRIDAVDSFVESDLNYQSSYDQLDLSIARPDITKKLHLQPRANTVSDTLSLPSSIQNQAGIAAPTAAQNINAQLPAMQLIILPLMIMKWLGSFWGGFENLPNRYGGGRRAKRDLQSPPTRRAHARSWNVVE